MKIPCVALSYLSILLLSFSPAGEAFGQTENLAARFDEQPGIISIPHSVGFEVSQFTFEAWIKRSSAPEGDGDNGIFVKSGPSSEYKLWIQGAHFPQGLCFAANSALESFHACSRTTIMWPNQWYHVAVTFDGSAAIVYLDGVAVAVDTGQVDISSVDGSLIVGEYLSRLSADVDDVRFWNVARTQEAILASMHQDLVGDEPGLIGYWQFNDSSGVVVPDKTPNANHGQIEGAVQYVSSSAPGTYEPPSTPKGLRGWGDDGSATLVWFSDTAATLAGYTIYRSTTMDFDPMTSDSVAFVTAPGMTYSDGGLVNDQRYYYRLRSLDNLGYYSRTTRPMVVKPNVISEDYITAVAYYPWYQDEQGWKNNQGEHLVMRNRLNPPQPPLLGLYSSYDTSTIRQHIEWSEQYGIDLWAVSWWGDLQRFTTITLRDYIAPLLVGRDLKYCVFMEFLFHPERDNLPTTIGEREIGLFVDYLTECARDHFGHPNYFKIDGKPVVFLYSTFNYFGDLQYAFGRIRDAIREQGYELYLIGDEIQYELGDPSVSDHMSYLDAVTRYARHLGPEEVGYPAESGFLLNFADDFNRKALIAEDLGIAVVPNVSPGINSRGTMTEDGILLNQSPILTRQVEPGASNTSTLEEEIRIARTVTDPDLNLLWITSWNEWFEDTQIEPTVVASATSLDNSQTGALFSGGHAYEGYGMTNLEVVRDLLGGPRTALRIESPGAPVAVGDTIHLNVVTARVSDLGGFQFEVSFDPQIVQAVSATIGPFLGSSGRTSIPATPSIDNVEGRLTFGAASSGSEPGAQGSGVLAMITFVSAGLGRTLVEPDVVELSTVAGLPIQPTTWTPGQISVSTGSMNWTRQLSGSFVRLYSVSVAGASVAWSSGVWGTVLRTIDGGHTWSQAWNGSSALHIYNIEGVNSDIALVAGLEGSIAESTHVAFIFRTEDGGATWQETFRQPLGWVSDITMFDMTRGISIGDPVDDVWTILVTSDGGRTWSPTPDAPSANANEGLSTKSVFWLTDSIGWFGTSLARMFHTTNGGTTWEVETIPSLLSVQSLAFDLSGVGLAAHWEGEMVRTTDGGTSWHDITAPDSGILRHIVAHDNSFWVLIDNSVHRSDDEGSTWTLQTSAVSTLQGLSLLSVEGGTYGYAVGNDGLILQYQNFVTNVGLSDRPLVPQEFAVSLNYPNPFNPSTTIEYDVPRRSVVTLSVYNLLGQHVATLVDGETRAGSHSAVWIGTSGSGVQVSSGVYYCRMHAKPVAGGEEFVSTQKLLLLR